MSDGDTFNIIILKRKEFMLKVSPKLKRLIAETFQLDKAGTAEMYSSMLEGFKYAKGEAGPQNIYSLVHQIINAMLELGISSNNVNSYTIWGLAPFLFYCTAQSVTDYSRGKTDDFLSKMHEYYRNNSFSKSVYRHLQTAVNLICKFHDTGSLLRQDIPHREAHPLCTNYERLLSTYLEKFGDYYSESPNTLETRCSAIRLFLSCMEQQGICSAEQFTHRSISDSITKFSSLYGGGLKNRLCTVRKFLLFLHEAGITPVDFRTAVPTKVPQRRKIRPGFSDEETTAILDSVNRSSRIGKRDYAIMLTAAKTGLRAMDIVNMKFQDIDWRSNEIRIVQQKTGKLLCLPLSPKVGNAIAEYILNARGNSKANYIFVKRQNSEQHIERKAVTALTKKYMTLAGVSTDIKYRGVHSFRRGFGKKLLESSVPLDMINELLGHTDMNSLRPYLAIDELGLKNCAISLASVEMGAVAK